MTGSLTEILVAQETRVSALIDGEASLPFEDSAAITAVERHQYYHYQLIRQTLRGAAMTADALESSTWSQIRFEKLWAKVDGLVDIQTS